MAKGPSEKTLPNLAGFQQWYDQLSNLSPIPKKKQSTVLSPWGWGSTWG